MHFMVTARMTPFRPGASPPPVSIPTLFTSAIRLLLHYRRHGKGQSSKPAPHGSWPAGPGRTSRAGRETGRCAGNAPHRRVRAVARTLPAGSSDAADPEQRLVERSEGEKDGSNGRRSRVWEALARAGAAQGGRADDRSHDRGPDA